MSLELVDYLTKQATIGDVDKKLKYKKYCFLANLKQKIK